MNKIEKKEFVSTLMDRLKDEILDKIEDGSIPEEWDGHELRMLIRDKAAQVVWKGTASRTVIKNYNNNILVRNIL
jgi:hypothetical protein